MKLANGGDNNDTQPMTDQDIQDCVRLWRSADRIYEKYGLFFSPHDDGGEVVAAPGVRGGQSLPASWLHLLCRFSGVPEVLARLDQIKLKDDKKKERESKKSAKAAESKVEEPEGGKGAKELPTTEEPSDPKIDESQVEKPEGEKGAKELPTTEEPSDPKIDESQVEKPEGEKGAKELPTTEEPSDPKINDNERTKGGKQKERKTNKATKAEVEEKPLKAKNAKVMEEQQVTPPQKRGKPKEHGSDIKQPAEKKTFGFTFSAVFLLW